MLKDEVLYYLAKKDLYVRIINEWSTTSRTVDALRYYKMYKDKAHELNEEYFNLTKKHIKEGI